MRPMSSQRRSASVAVALLACLAALLASPASLLAADPQPSPVVFPQPHYLVFMESHSTMDGPVVDDTYWLYPYLPDDGDHFVVPDGAGTVWHYIGRVVSGPYRTDHEACPPMLALGISSLTTWTTAAGEQQLVVDCQRFRATPAPTPTTGSGAPDAGAPDAGGTGPDRDDEPDDVSLGIAVALIGLLLFGGGSAGVVIGRRNPGADFGPGARRDLDVDPHPPEDQPPADPCADQAAAVERASLEGRYLNDLLASCRRYEDMLQTEIDVLANLTLPGSVVLDLAFMAGGLAGGGAKLLAREVFWKELGKAVGEAAIKDAVKDIAKQSLKPEAYDAWTTAGEGGQGGAKEALVNAVRESLVNKKFFGQVSPHAPVKVFKDSGSYIAFTKELQAYADDLAGPVSTGIGLVLDAYGAAKGGLELKARLDQLRAIRDGIADRRVDLEMRFESALEAQRFAAERLAHCQRINAPDWRP
jgi:hypothetical protein